MSATPNPSSSNRANTDRTRASVGTPYLVAYFATAIGAFVGSAVLGSPGLGVHGPWLFVGLLAVGCALSRAGVTPEPATAPASEPVDVRGRSLVLVKDLKSWSSRVDAVRDVVGVTRLASRALSSGVVDGEPHHQDPGVDTALGRGVAVGPET
jgi:hypothetical protein